MLHTSLLVSCQCARCQLADLCWKLCDALQYLPATVLLSYSLMFKTVDSMLQAFKTPIFEQIGGSLSVRISESHAFWPKATCVNQAQNQLWMHARQMPLLFSLSQHVKSMSSRSTCAIMRAAKFSFTSYVHSISTVLPGKGHRMCVCLCLYVSYYGRSPLVAASTIRYNGAPGFSLAQTRSGCKSAVMSSSPRSGSPSRTSSTPPRLR